ncbi:unknown [Odoribacter laneus CAG:561]|nr:unknown [Odoribacter laneus CAG:561]
MKNCLKSPYSKLVGKCFSIQADKKNLQATSFYDTKGFAFNFEKY